LITKDRVYARIEELKKAISDGVIQLAIRERSARVQILQDNLDRLRKVIAARAFEYGGHLGGATGMLVKDYRGKNAEEEVYRFDAALVAQINDTLKQAAIEEGQWKEKRETAGTNVNILMDLINEGRTRVADEQEAREAAEARKP
jgi:gas vesicle protein